MTPTSKCVAALALSVAAAVCGARQAPDPHAHHHMPAAEQLTRSTATYRLDGLSLLRADGKAVTLTEELDHDGPLVLDFVFTTCTTICPILSRTFAQLQSARGLRLVSISIDPQHDTPAVLRSYARQFEAGKAWRFYTGTVAQSVAVQRAFDVYRGNKMNHVPLTFVRRARGEPWVRLEGYASAAALARELAP
ncbi:MAG: SCO1/SenC [Massilia sp.]|nr:SCO1/SenC [Massilia sp.]